ncbi:hypothetical protein AYO44_01735 [Planctomycetaceae bacterium SCGC AG-212-F19]|nr:hypothetical protein AYO44_01735 [Planctomycetaceae bacterium SCGC AG-212-F19]
MNYTAITISRDYGAGGSEVAKALADRLGWELLDRELLHKAAAIEEVPDAELERLDEQAVGLADRFRLHPPHERYIHGLREAARQAAQRGKVVLVGRGTRQLLGDTPGVFHLQLVASQQWRAQRMAWLERLPLEKSLARCTEFDRARQRFTQYFFGEESFLPSQYDIVVNAERMALEDVACVVGSLAPGAPTTPPPGAAGRVLTLAREVAAGDQRFPCTLGERLGMRVCDRELLEQEAVRLGVPEADIEHIEEHPSGIFQRFRPGSLYQRYCDVLGQLMQEHAARGEVLLVGRGSSRFLRDNPRAFHVRLVASMAMRVRQVMQDRWLREELAQREIAESDSQRARFYEGYFRADWADPLEYHITVNTGRLGPLAVDMVARAAERFWARALT